MSGLPKPVYVMSEPHLSGYRVIIGYETMVDAQAAQLALSKPPAREDAQPVAPWGHAVKFGANGWGFADDEDPDAIDALKADPEYQVLALYTHPAPDALRVAVEAFDVITDLSVNLRQGGPDSSDLNDLSDALNTAVDVAHEALAALQAEQKGGA